MQRTKGNRRFGSVVRVTCALMLLGVITLNAESASEERTSLLVNGGFERGEGAHVPGWSLAFWPPGTDREIAPALRRAENVVHSGRAALVIDTSPVLGQETTLVWNGAIRTEGTNLRGKRLRLTGWVYVDPKTALRPFGFRLRAFGRNAEGQSVFLADVLEIKVLGEPGRWTRFEAIGTVPDLDVRSMDLHGAIRPDVVPTVQVLDDLRVDVYAPPIELDVLSNAVWDDATALAVRVARSTPPEDGDRFTFLLRRVGGDRVATWERPGKAGLYGLALSEPLTEGSYRLTATLLRRDGSQIAAVEGTIEVTASPWSNLPTEAPTDATPPNLPTPPAYDAAGTVAPTFLADVVPEAAEPLSPDLELSEWETRGYVAFSRQYTEPVSRKGRPRPGEIGTIRLFIARREYEPTTVSVWARKPLRDVRVTVGNLVAANAVLPASQVDVRVVRRIAGLPPFLEKRDRIDLPSGETATFWITLFAPNGIKPGFYRGTVDVSASNAATTRIPLLVRVLPITLPPSARGYGFWWAMDSRWNGLYSKERAETLEQIRRQFVLLREHGANMVAVYTLPKLTRRNDGGIDFDFTRDQWGHHAYSFADLARLGRETGFFRKQVPLQFAGAENLQSNWVARAVGIDRDSQAFEAFYRDACRRIDAWARERGIRLAFAVVDEIGNAPERRRTALRFYRVAHEAGVLTSVTDNGIHGGVHLMGQDRFDAIIGMRLYNFIMPEMVEDARTSGDALWLYNLASGGRDPKRDRFVWGFFTERIGVDGYAQWAFQWPSGNRDPYAAAAEGAFAGYFYALPAPDGPLPTLAFEGVREGIDDARYLARLRERAPDAPEATLDDIPPYSPRIDEYVAARSGRAFDARRWRIARALLRAR